MSPPELVAQTGTALICTAVRAISTPGLTQRGTERYSCRLLITLSRKETGYKLLLLFS